ncbi:MAG: bifunctional 2-polyprenyl-6-hydroxyphenol methylase/3-demethylubiquinol 3-O-methyltransferase UbiG [Alphaproteobacteria bacterium]
MKREAAGSVDAAEVHKFEREAESWWDTGGLHRPLHVMNPARIAIIKAAIVKHFGREADSLRPFEGLSLLDLGCGGGLVAEPMARLGARVTGVDPGAANIKIAAAHAARMGLPIDYRCTTPEEMAEAGQQFDVMLALEIVEHTADPFGLVELCARAVAPGGLLIMSTLNRTLKSLALAKIGAEYLLRWVPRGTHEFRKFVTPRELRYAFEAAGLLPAPPTGLRYRPLKDEWAPSLDTSINYIMCASKPR